MYPSIAATRRPYLSFPGSFVKAATRPIGPYRVVGGGLPQRGRALLEAQRTGGTLVPPESRWPAACGSFLVSRRHKDGS